MVQRMLPDFEAGEAREERPAEEKRRRVPIAPAPAPSRDEPDLTEEILAIRKELTNSRAVAANLESLRDEMRTLAECLKESQEQSAKATRQALSIAAWIMTAVIISAAALVVLAFK